MASTYLKISSQGPLVTVELNRPDIHNAFDDTLIAELTECFVTLSNDPDVRVVVLSGAGPSFCAGADLAWMSRMAQYTHEENVKDARALQQMMAAIGECSKLTIARVHGAAIGGGAGLVAACDIAIVADVAKFAFSEVRLGLIPAVIAPYVVDKIGYGSARSLFVTGDRFGADEALRIGLVQQVVPAAELDAAVQRRVEMAFQVGPHAVTAAKRLLEDIRFMTPAQIVEATTERIAALRVSPEGQEGIRAFLEKREPQFDGTAKNAKIITNQRSN